METKQKEEGIRLRDFVETMDEKGCLHILNHYIRNDKRLYLSLMEADPEYENEYLSYSSACLNVIEFDKKGSYILENVLISHVKFTEDVDVSGNEIKNCFNRMQNMTLIENHFVTDFTGLKQMRIIQLGEGEGTFKNRYFAFLHYTTKGKLQ